MNLLCWDTCGEIVTVTVVKENRCFFFSKKQRLQDKGPASFLLPMLVQACQESGLSLSHIDGLGVVRGPGSLTGIKVGLSAAYGLSYALKKPLYGETLFELWKQNFQERFPEKFCCLVVDTYGATFATQLLTPEGNFLGPPALHTSESLESFLLKQGLSPEKMIIGGTMNQSRMPLKVFSAVFEEVPGEASSYSLAQKMLHSSFPSSSFVKPFYLHPPAVLPPTF